MKVGIIGGTGPAGRAIALRLAASGHEVVVGSRDANRAEAVAAELLAGVSDRGLHIAGGGNDEVVRSELIVLATPWEAAVATAQSFVGELSGKVLVTMVNALAKVGNEFQALVFARGSVAASLQAVLPGTEVVAAFQHLPARELGDISSPIEGDVLVASDTHSGFETVRSLTETVPGLRAVYCGSLASANAVESLTAVLLNVNIRYRSHVSLRLSGLKESGA